MPNDEIFESSLRFLFNQIDLHVKHNTPKDKKGNKSNYNNNNGDDGWVNLKVKN